MSQNDQHANLSKSEEILKEHEVRQILSSTVRVLKVRDISVGRTPEGTLLLLHGPIEVDVGKESPKDHTYPHRVEGVATVELSQLAGHLDSLQANLPTDQEQILENQKKILKKLDEIIQNQLPCQ